MTEHASKIAGDFPMVKIAPDAANHHRALVGLVDTYRALHAAGPSAMRLKRS